MKFEKLITRPDGSQVKIVAEQCVTPWGHSSIGNYVLHRQGESDQWRVCRSTPSADSRNMSVDDYVRHGRIEMLQKATVGEILMANDALLRAASV